MYLLNFTHLQAIRSLLYLQIPTAVVDFTTTPLAVDLGYARYQGTANIGTNTTSFLGIRYAAPPVGNLRWAAPQPPETLSGVRNATKIPNECYQASMGRSPTNPSSTVSISRRAMTQSEDCLFLSVYIPGNKVNSVNSGGLPVLVWIHGGGYISGAEYHYDGADLILKSNHSLIVVTVQYRLGLFGFLAGEEINRSGALNAGLLDQNFALQWVQSHIGTFGGDPGKVSIWGISAGGGSVLQHVIAHGGNTHPPLFRAAITSSSFVPSQYQYNDHIPELLYNEVVIGTNCASSPDTLACLRAADISNLESLNYRINQKAFYGVYTFVPVVDGRFITERPTVTLARGKVNGEALYSVTNSHEGNMFVDQTSAFNISQYIKTLFPNMHASQAAQAVPLYEGFGTNVNQASYAMAIFVCPTYYLLEAFGGRAWKGEFAVPPGDHGQDQQYYFTSATSDFITAFSSSFLSMVVSLNPGDTPGQWSPWAVGNTEMMFNVTSSGAPDVYTYTTDDALLTRCAYWRSVSANTAQ